MQVAATLVLLRDAAQGDSKALSIRDRKTFDESRTSRTSDIGKSGPVTNSLRQLPFFK